MEEEKVKYIPLGRSFYHQENEGTKDWRGLSIESMEVSVHSYYQGNSDASITFINNEGLVMNFLLRERDIKRLAIQLLMGVL